MLKVAEDALRAYGILKDDSPKYVRETVIQVHCVVNNQKQKTPGASGSKKNAKNEDYLEITIKPYEQQPIATPKNQSTILD